MRFERMGDALIVSSPADRMNFLFRAPGTFAEADRPDGFLVALAAGEGARVRLRLTELAAGELGKDPGALAAARADAYAASYEVRPAISGDGARRLVRVEGKRGLRLVLLVRDGTRLYELFFEQEPADAGHAQAFAEMAEGFTILAPKGLPTPAVPDAEAARERILEHDFYRIRLLKPAGFTEEGVDPDRDPGIWIRLRREDPHRNLSEIVVLSHLGRTLQRSPDEMAQAALDAFTKRYLDTRAPRRPQRISWPNAKVAYKLAMAGRLEKSGLIVRQEYRLVDHDNGRVYEFFLTTYAGADREFRKEIAAFWKSIRIEDR